MTTRRRAPRLLVIHGPNLQLLGQRPVNIYGRVDLPAINRALEREAQALGASVEIVQSNHEGEIVERIGQAHGRFDAIVINPAAYTHTSVAIRDAIEAARVPAVEVHLSNIAAREDFRHTSLIVPVCRGQISGFGAASYLLGVRAALVLLQQPARAARRRSRQRRRP